AAAKALGVPLLPITVADMNDLATRFTSLSPAGQHQDDAGRGARRLVRISHHQDKIVRFEHRSEHLTTGNSIPAIGPSCPRLQRSLADKRSGDRLGEIAGD